MSVPLSLILKELEGTPSAIIPILSSLYYDKSILNGISKPDSKHLVSRTLNLARSANEYNKWAGTNIIRVIGDNYTILANEGFNLFNQLIKNLESYNETINIKILTSTIESLNYLCDKIRGKPTLTREILTPKLATIITLYLEKLHYSPLLIIRSLKKLIKFHPTTFRPFGNKLRAKLIGFLHLNEFTNFPTPLKNAIYQTIATLPAIEKTDPEIKWELDVRSLVKELKSVLTIYQEFLNLNDDSSIVKLFENLPSFEENQQSERILPDLAIDVNEPQSVFQISTRIEILLNLLKAYLTYETQFSVKVPLGLVLTANELVCSINVRFLSFKGDIRDDQIRKIIKATTVLNSMNSVKFVKELAFVYKGSLLPHLDNIFSFLEVIVPFKNKKIDYDELIIQELVSTELLSCVSTLLSLVSYLSDYSPILRFVDLALLLVEPRVVDSQTLAKPANINVISNGKKNKKKKNNSSIPLSDLLSHQHLFAESIPPTTSKTVREFLNAIITTVSLPPTQHYRIMRYLIIEAVHARHYNNEHLIPAGLKSLLINAVLFPGYEKISLLPIVSSIFGDDPLLSVFNNPRFPPLPIYIKSASAKILEEQEVEDEDEDEDEVVAEVKDEIAENENEESQPKRRKLETNIVPAEAVSEDKEKIFSEVNPDTVIQFAPSTAKKSSFVGEASPISEETQHTSDATIVSSGVAVSNEDIEEDGSDFEMPEINVGDSDEE